MPPNDIIHLLRHGGFEQRVPALCANERRHVLKAVEFFSPWLCVGDGLLIQPPATFRTLFLMLFHNRHFLRVHGSTQMVGSYQWTVMMYAWVPSNAQET